MKLGPSGLKALLMSWSCCLSGAEKRLPIWHMYGHGTVNHEVVLPTSARYLHSDTVYITTLSFAKGRRHIVLHV